MACQQHHYRGKPQPSPGYFPPLCLTHCFFPCLLLTQNPQLNPTRNKHKPRAGVCCLPPGPRGRLSAMTLSYSDLVLGTYPCYACVWRDVEMNAVLDKAAKACAARTSWEGTEKQPPGVSITKPQFTTCCRPFLHRVCRHQECACGRGGLRAVRQGGKKKRDHTHISIDEPRTPQHDMNPFTLRIDGHVHAYVDLVACHSSLVVLRKA